MCMSDYKKTKYCKLRVGFNNVYRQVLRLSHRSSVYMNNNKNLEALLLKLIYGLNLKPQGNYNDINKCMVHQI